MMDVSAKRSVNLVYYRQYNRKCDYVRSVTHCMLELTKQSVSIVGLQRKTGKEMVKIRNVPDHVQTNCGHSTATIARTAHHCVWKNTSRRAGVPMR